MQPGDQQIKGLSQVLTMEGCMIRVVPEGGEVSVGVGGVWFPRVAQTFHARFVGPWAPRVQEGVLVLAEAQDDVNTVDAPPHRRPSSLHHLVKVPGRETAVIHHAHGIQ